METPEENGSSHEDAEKDEVKPTADVAAAAADGDDDDMSELSEEDMQETVADLQPPQGDIIIPLLLL